MTPNQDSERARAYHARTAHSPESVRASRHTLEWDNKPSPFKIYPDLPAVALPRDFAPPGVDCFEALSHPSPASPNPLDLERLAALLFFAAGITKRKTYAGGAQVYFRAAPSTGALYQTEAYVVAGEVTGLGAGLYHFGPGDFALRQLREGDYRGTVAAAAADEALAARPAILILSGLYWRNTWKYEARGYRHLFWDAGAMLANALAAAAALGVAARVVQGFVDAEVNALLGLDATREGALVLLALGDASRPAPAPPPTGPLNPAVIPLSASEVAYPLLVEAYADSRLERDAEVMDWRERAADGEAPTPDAGPLSPLPEPRLRAGRALAETILARGSTREFSGASITAQALGDALYHATRGIPGDVPGPLVDLYLAVHAVDGLAPGAYVYDAGRHALGLVRTGMFRRESAFLCLEQPLGGASSATVFFLADLARVLRALGNRGYRAANLEAGIVGGRLYLAAYAQRFGASGLTFYDAQVVKFFSPPAAGKDALFVTALGRSARAPR